MLLGIALFCIAIVGYQGLSNGKKALMDRIYSQLTSVRESKRAQVQTWLKEMQSHVQAMAIDRSVITASREFISAYQRLEDKTLSHDQLANLKNYYVQQYLPQLSKKLKISPLLEHYLPVRNDRQYLQYHYISQAQTTDKDSSDNKSYYAGVHQYYHPVFREMIQAYGIEDMFLVDIKTGDIVYSVMKNVDFSRNLYSGAFSVSNLGNLAKTIHDTQSHGKVSISDFDFYKPSYGKPSAFMGTTIFDESQQAIAMLMIGVPQERLNDVMTGKKGWESQGLGKTGEAFLVGDDLLMRSNARLLHNSKNCYADSLVNKHLLDENTAERICQLKTSVLLQKVSNPALKKALQGGSGTQIIDSYSGKKALVAYAPLLLEQLNWAIIAQIDLSEANAPIHAFQKQLTISGVIIASIVTLFAMFLAYLFTRPIDILMKGANQLSKGNTEVNIKLDRNDEYGQLAKTFNHTAQLLNQKEKLIKEKSQQYETLLKNILPPKIANKYKANKSQSFSEKVENVTVLYTTLGGFKDHTNSTNAEQSINLLNELITAIDKLSQKHGIEKIKTIGDCYLAACGLTIPRLNHSQRCVNFSLDLLQLLQHFNRTHSTPFTLRVGLHTGTVLSGIVGEDKLCFDVWGEAVSQASLIRFSATKNSIIITEAVYKNLTKQSLFTQHDVVKTKEMGEISIYIHSTEVSPSAEDTNDG